MIPDAAVSNPTTRHGGVATKDGTVAAPHGCSVADRTVRDRIRLRSLTAVSSPARAPATGHRSPGEPEVRELRGSEILKTSAAFNGGAAWPQDQIATLAEAHIGPHKDCSPCAVDSRAEPTWGCYRGPSARITRNTYLAQQIAAAPACRAQRRPRRDLEPAIQDLGCAGPGT